MKRLEQQLEDDESIAVIDQTSALKIRLLTPLVIAILILLLVTSISLFYNAQRSNNYQLVGDRISRTHLIAEKILDETIRNDVNALRAMLTTLVRNEKLTGLFARYDREELYRHSKLIFEDLKQTYNISHFYFTRPDRVNLLRVHAPRRHGDLIDRITTIDAEKNQSISYGIELGVLGTLTLRVVAPLYEPNTKHLIGYIELGKEIGHVVDQVSQIFGHKMVVLIHKNMVDRNSWEAGMRELGRSVDWNQFKSVIVSTEFSSDIPLIIRNRLRYGYEEHHGPVTELEYDGTIFWLISIPISDAADRKIADLALVLDSENELRLMEHTILLVGITIFLLGAVLAVFYSYQAKRIGRRIEEDHRILQQLAIYDGLTGLYNRRMFDEYLEEELNRSKRFSHPLSVLLIDIDHFKKVNDNYGHQVGDFVLQEVAKRITREVRNVDHVCRYGGEELTIILPETDPQNAEKYAKRIINVIAALPFFIEGHSSIDVTVSIGVSSYPSHGDSCTLLVSAADKALYNAKNAGRNRVCIYDNHKLSIVTKIS